MDGNVGAKDENGNLLYDYKKELNTIQKYLSEGSCNYIIISSHNVLLLFEKINYFRHEDHQSDYCGCDGTDKHCACGGVLRLLRERPLLLGD